jgi:hypothetical protein
MHKATGGGYEDYPNTIVSFLDVDNIHVMHESLDKLKKVPPLPMPSHQSVCLIN